MVKLTTKTKQSLKFNSQRVRSLKRIKKTNSTMARWESKMLKMLTN